MSSLLAKAHAPGRLEVRRSEDLDSSQLRPTLAFVVGDEKREGILWPDDIHVSRPNSKRKKAGAGRSSKELYRELRALPWEQLWAEEVPRFDEAPAQRRMEHAALVRAVGVVFSESGAGSQRDAVMSWLHGLLRDPSEKIRRYAMAAIPKIGAGPAEEANLLALLRTTTAARERKFLVQALEKIGGTTTLEAINEGTTGVLLQAEQKVKASLARNEHPSALRTDRLLSEFAGVRIHLRGRRGLESIVREEVEGSSRTRGLFRVTGVGSGLVALEASAPFALADLYALRCFGTLSFVLGTVEGGEEDVARTITSPLSRRLLETFTKGSIRYRLEFVSRGHQRSAVRLLADRVYAMCPEILNDPRQAPWVVAIRPADNGSLVELSPKSTLDPRFAYRQHDVPAASHPPLAACLARLAGRSENDIVWDPFCGSGLELIERCLLGGASRVYGTDLSQAALATARANFDAANLKSVRATFTCSDFRDFARSAAPGRRALTLVITNPPMGKRVPIPDLPGLITDLFTAAATALKPGGRLVFVNPLPMESPVPSLKLRYRQEIDLGGFECFLEKHVKSPD